MRKSIKVAAVFLGLSFLAGQASADLATEKKKDPGKESAGKSKGGKAGDACKTTADCDQSAGRQQCRDSKCESAPPVHPVT